MMNRVADPGVGIVRVAVPSPLRQLFDYLPARDPAPPPVPGARVRVPFGRGHRVGLVVETGARSQLPRARLRRVEAVLDAEPVLSAELVALLTWAAGYFHHPIGDVVASALPAPLRRGRVAERRPQRHWRRIRGCPADAAEQLAAGAIRQRALLARIADYPGRTAEAELATCGGRWRDALRALVGRGLVEACPGLDAAAPVARAGGPALGEAQQTAVDTVAANRGSYRAVLLDGVTGSGKTEDHRHLTEQVVAAGRQVLVLVPEIGLTPQLVARFSERIGDGIAVLHSGLAEGERLDAWLRARDGSAAVIIGTRSAVFAPLACPGLLIVDEEHDPSFKQQEGFRYSARDLAVVRASRNGHPLVLGSATPSLESIANVLEGRYATLRMSERAVGSTPPEVEVIDLRARTLDDGLSQPLLDALAATLERGDQALLYLNRRGYAPTLLCHQCGWVAQCARCDARLVHHRGDARLRCHHCAADLPIPECCPQCSSAALRAIGLGTERVAAAVVRHFPAARVARLDRDATRRRGALEAALAAVRGGDTAVLVGTQMLAKGHDFPRVTLVAIVDADGGLFSADFRGPERVAQCLTQVAGRAGRGERPGRVLVQTHHPEHPLLTLLVRRGYRGFARAALAERQAACLPPFSRHALLRVDAHRRDAAEGFAAPARGAAPAVSAVSLYGPLPAPLGRRAGRHRVQVLVESVDRPTLHRFLEQWLTAIASLRGASRVRWSLDVDPVDLL